MHIVTEIHAFTATNALGETTPLGTIDATGDECISTLFGRIVRDNPRYRDLGPAIDAAFHACERIPGDGAVGEAPLGGLRIVCTHTLH